MIRYSANPDIIQRFKHRLKNENASNVIASLYLEFALKIDSIGIDSRCRTIALERLEESYMWASKEPITMDGLDEVSED